MTDDVTKRVKRLMELTDLALGAPPELQAELKEEVLALTLEGRPENFRAWWPAAFHKTFWPTLLNSDWSAAARRRYIKALFGLGGEA